MNNLTRSLLMFAIVLSSQKSFSEDSTPNTTENPKESTELTDGPQTLPTPDEVISPKTESIPAVKSETNASTDLPIEEVVKQEDKIDDKPIENDQNSKEIKQAKIDLKKRSQVVMEDELLKPNEDSKAKIKNSKVKTQKVTESEIYIQEADKYKLNDTFKNLQLNDVIEQGLRKNYDKNIRAQKDHLNEVEFDGVKSAFWLPELKITLTTTNQRISTLHSSSAPATNPTSITPSGALGLSLGDYTVFNWGKDYALFLNKKTTYERNKLGFDEAKRELKLDLISDYFYLVSTKSIEKIRQDQLRQASFIYRLNKEKITIGKTSKQDYYQARSEYLKAQNDYHDAKISADQADENLAFTIADEVGTKYVINEFLDYRRIKLTMDEALSLSSKNNPSLLDSKATLENAERSYDIALKENMPLPKFTMNLGAYNKRFGAASNSTLYESNSGGNIELVASINASWSLTGEDGLFNSNKLAKSHIGKEIAFKELEKGKHYTQSLIRQTYKNILSMQNQIVILEARLPSIQKTFDTILENYLSGKTKYYDFHIALEELSTTKVLYEDTKLLHLKQKLTLAKLCGIEDFPGENFEQLAQRIKGK